MGEVLAPAAFAQRCSVSDASELARWLIELLAETLQADAGSIRSDAPLWEYGMDSLVAATLLAEINDELAVWVDPADVPPGISVDDLVSIVMDSARLATEEDIDVA
jgi:acyl carrier protein